MFRGFGAMEIGLILVIVLIVFGAGKLPQIGGALGKSIREFKKSSRGEDESEKPLESKAQTPAKADEKSIKD